MTVCVVVPVAAIVSVLPSITYYMLIAHTGTIEGSATYSRIPNQVRAGFSHRGAEADLIRRKAQLAHLLQEGQRQLPLPPSTARVDGGVVRYRIWL